MIGDQKMIDIDISSLSPTWETENEFHIKKEYELMGNVRCKNHNDISTLWSTREQLDNGTSVALISCTKCEDKFISTLFLKEKK